ncbi:hypothetical protein BOTBODRAFT_648089 [Botryobasidium botryosum FD-172 SS1]|uniref:Uncharacterized protein n=1 Tax=Botryobasidium botryosum (strain FD-172 SS1) TaxID=930990 RepID=A0A067LWS2_BOTB1|nr:hypothetical protein BOTBODRAFT_648089 [Botryobasidium botryosum FD-172 SS1]
MEGMRRAGTSKARPSKRKFSSYSRLHQVLAEFDDDSEAVEPKVVAASAPTKSGPGRHPQGCLLRIQQAVLNHSKTFRVMFPLSHPEGKGTSDDNPIHLPDDPEHFCGAPSEYHGPTVMPHPDKPSVEYIVGVLRVARKYGFALAEEWALRALRTEFSVGSRQWQDALARPSREDIQRSLVLLRLAQQEGGLDDFLGAALYLLCTEETWDEDECLYGGMHIQDASRLAQGTRRLYRLSGSKSTVGVGWRSFIRTKEVIEEVITAMAP